MRGSYVGEVKLGVIKGEKGSCRLIHYDSSLMQIPITLGAIEQKQ